MQIEHIIDMEDMQAADSDAEKFCIENIASNVMSFVGEHGMGKSSAMLSFAYLLRKYPQKRQAF